MYYHVRIKSFFLSLVFLNVSVLADDHYQAATPASAIQTYVHRSIIGSGVVSYPGGVSNSSHGLSIKQTVVANAPCDEVDANGKSKAHPVLLVKLENTGSMPRDNYGDNRCYITSYNIDTAEARIAKDSDDPTGKTFQLDIPFSAQQAGDWHSGVQHQGTHHYCGQSAWVLQGFQVEYSIYCVPNANP